MTRPGIHEDTGAWHVQTWISFLLAVGAMVVSILYVDASIWQRAFLGLGLFFTVSSTFGLAKSVRDRHENEKLHHKIDEAKTEAVLRDFHREAA